MTHCEIFNYFAIIDSNYENIIINHLFTSSRHNSSKFNFPQLGMHKTNHILYFYMTALITILLIDTVIVLVLIRQRERGMV